MTRIGNADTGFFIPYNMQLIFDDNQLHKKLSPFALTRPIAEIRFGILTFKETWELVLSSYYTDISIAYNTEDYLYAKYAKPIDTDSITIAGNIKPTKEIAKAVYELAPNTALYVNSVFIAKKGNGTNENIDLSVTNLISINACWEIFQKNGEAIEVDYSLLTNNQNSIPLPETVQVSKTGANKIFIAEGAKIEHAIFNTDNGPIYIGKGATVMDGAIIRGPFALCQEGVVKMGAKIYGPTTIGPFCKVGGEISNAVFQAYSNKGHDGFLGNSVIGEWCNLGADTNSSNLKNNYSNVKVYSYETQQIEKSSVLFCGLLMGDHSKTGINTMLNTATVVGVSANIFGGGFPKKYIPSFVWGGVDKTDRFILDKAFEVAKSMMERRKIDLTDGDKEILTYLYHK